MKYLQAKAGQQGKDNPPREYQTAIRRVTPAEMKSLGANPIRLVPDPGAGKMVVPILCIVSGSGGTPYIGQPNPVIIYAGDTNSLFLNMNAIGGFVAPFREIMQPAEVIDAKVNAGLMLGTDDVGELVDGDYPVDIRIEYEIVDV